MFNEGFFQFRQFFFVFIEKTYMWVYFLFGWGKNFCVLIYIYLLNSIEMLEINLDNLKLSRWNCIVVIYTWSKLLELIHFVFCCFSFFKRLFYHFLSIFTTFLLWSNQCHYRKSTWDLMLRKLTLNLILSLKDFQLFGLLVFIYLSCGQINRFKTLLRKLKLFIALR